MIEGQSSPLALIEIQDIAFDFKKGRTGANVTTYFYTGQPSVNYLIRQDLKKVTWGMGPEERVCR